MSRLLSLPAPLIALIFRRARRVLHGMACCRALRLELPRDASQMQLTIKPADSLPRLSSDCFTPSDVCKSLLRFENTPRLRLGARSAPYKVDSASFGLDFSLDHRSGCRVAQGPVCAYKIERLLVTVNQINKSLTVVTLGIEAALRSGRLRSLAVLCVCIPCSVDALEAVIRASSRTLTMISLSGDCVLYADELRRVAACAAQCKQLKRFTLCDVDPATRQEAAEGSAEHSGVCVDSALLLLRAVPLKELRLLLCNLTDADVTCLADGVRASETLQLLDVTGSLVTDEGAPCLIHLLPRLVSLGGLPLDTDETLRLLLVTLRANKGKTRSIGLHGYHDFDRPGMAALSKLCREQNITIRVSSCDAPL